MTRTRGPNLPYKYIDFSRFYYLIQEYWKQLNDVLDDYNSKWYGLYDKKYDNQTIELIYKLKTLKPYQSNLIILSLYFDNEELSEMLQIDQNSLGAYLSTIRQKLKHLMNYVKKPKHK